MLIIAITYRQYQGRGYEELIGNIVNGDGVGKQMRKGLYLLSSCFRPVRPVIVGSWAFFNSEQEGVNAMRVCQFYIMLKTIFSDNKINEFPIIDNLSNCKDITIFGVKQLRMSLSPKKIKTSKKFFYSIRNKSIKKLHEEASAHNELQALIRKEKIFLMAQRTSLNDLLLPNFDIPGREAELMGLPSIEIKKISESDCRNNKLRKMPEKRGIIDLIDCKGAFQSNILRSKKGDYQTLTNTNKINWPVRENPEERRQNAKREQKYALSIPKINKRASSLLEEKVDLQESPQLPKNSESYSPSRLNQAKSVYKFDQKASIDKKFKKGFLSYEPNGQECWQKIRQGIQKQPCVKIQNSGRILSAKIYYIYDVELNQPIAALNEVKDIEIASLSKIMTCYLSILICKKYEVDMKNCYYRVPDKIPETPGTSAELTAGDLLNVQDLLYGLMLPSGNDASICLAELMGKAIQRHKKKQQKRTYFQTFMSSMNSFSKQLGLNQEWNNSSGLPSNPNFSTAQAIIALSALAIKNDLFRKIVSTKQIELEIKNDRYGLTTKKIWKNTNKLLEKGWQGVKTGTTETAGHCLISKRQNLLLGVFDCQTMSKRFTDSMRLYDYIAKIQQKS